MANPKHLALLKDVEAWNAWRRANPDIKKPDLSEVSLDEMNLRGANLRRATLRGATLRGAILRVVDLRGANLRKADLRGADLWGANLRGANLREADLSEVTELRRIQNVNGFHERVDLQRADLRGANLREANLHGADLREVDLDGADLSGASLFETIFPYKNLDKVKGLDTCRHIGPSTLDFRTLQQSGPLPLAFLRGCGLPDLLIDYLPSLLNQPIQFYSCFISYSSKDEKFARRLHADLQDNGVRCWFAPKDMQGGQKIREQIGKQIRLYEKLLLVLSEYSMNSEWVKTEIADARQYEKHEKRQVLFPIRLVSFKTIQQWECFDADTGKDSAREIREYFISDFSSWKNHQAYQQAFERLLQDLKPELKRKPES